MSYNINENKFLVGTPKKKFSSLLERYKEFALFENEPTGKGKNDYLQLHVVPLIPLCYDLYNKIE